ncbi:hypothetical protein ACFVH0_01530 [Streptomyces sp. NPDC127117]
MDPDHDGQPALSDGWGPDAEVETVVPGDARIGYQPVEGGR